MGHLIFCKVFSILEGKSEQLAGGSISIPVYTLSFAKHLEFKKNNNLSKKELLNEYIRMGGFLIVALGNFSKSILKTQEKFYLTDASLKYSMMGFNPKSIAAMLENIVYFELRRKDYDVYVGKNEAKEVDFVAVQRDERIYM